MKHFVTSTIRVFTDLGSAIAKSTLF